MIDRHAGEVGQEDRRLLVFLGELRSVLLLGEVEVAVGLSADEDRDPEK